jgi:hypothetical protein
MPLTSFEVAPSPEIDHAITIKADDGDKRVVAQIPRHVLDDYFPHRSLTDDQRLALVESNIDAFKAIISRKYEAGEWRDEPRFGSTIRRVDDIDMADIRSAPRLTDARLVMEEGAGFRRGGYE